MCISSCQIQEILVTCRCRLHLASFSAGVELKNRKDRLYTGKNCGINISQRWIFFFVNSLRPTDAFTKLTTIGSDNVLSPGRCQAITWTNAGILSIGPFGTNFSEIWTKVYTISFKTMHFKMSSGKWRSFCLSLNVLTLVLPKLFQEM